ncbi:MAG: DUF421 domain-containing protein [Firmicutes bacterium]|nr:DUF421 domain-containing protein [Bacillota bacterium]
MEWSTIFQYTVKPVAIYLAALALVRIMGKRALGQLGLFDLVIMAGIGDVIVVVALEQRVPFQKGLLILGMLGGMELLFSALTFRSKFFARLLEGKPTILIKDGAPIPENLAKEHISPTDLKQELRQRGVTRIGQVSQAVLEACGKFSVITKEEPEPVSNQQLLEEVTLLRQELKELKEFLRIREG